MGIDYDILLERYPYDKDLLDGYVELMLEVCCSTREYVRICGQEVPTEVVKSRLLKLNGEHIGYVIDSLKSNTTKIGNIKAYTRPETGGVGATLQPVFGAERTRGANRPPQL